MAHPELQAAKRAVTRDTLVAGALAAFVDLGYARTTVQDIADRSGLTRATFYKHFGSKAAVMPELQRVIDARWAPLYVELARLAAHPEVPGLTRWLLGAFDEWRELAAISRVRNEAAAIEHDLDDLARLREDVPAQRIADALVAAGGDPDDAPIQAIALVAPLTLYMRRFLERGEHDREHIADVLARLWVHGLADSAAG